jgi:hypothetical protein
MKTKKPNTRKSSTHTPIKFSTDKALRKAIKAQAKSRGVPVATLLAEIITAQVNQDPFTLVTHDTVNVNDLPGVRVPIQRSSEQMLMKPRYIGLNSNLEDRLIRLQCEATLSRLLLTNLCQHLMPNTDLDDLLEILLPEVQRLLEDPLLELDDYRAIHEATVHVTIDSEWPV